MRAVGGYVMKETIRKAIYEKFATPSEIMLDRISKGIPLTNNIEQYAAI